MAGRPRKSKAQSQAPAKDLTKAQNNLAQAKKQLELDSGKLRTARERLKEKRAVLAGKSTPARIAAVDKAYKQVADLVVAVAKAKQAEQVARAQCRAEKVLARVEAAEAAAQAKLDHLEGKLASATDGDLKQALDKFQQRWLKKRQLADAKKLKTAEKQLKAKIKQAAAKAKREAAAIVKKAEKSAIKTVVPPGRPGRPAAEGAEKPATPKRRGRPPKPVSTAVDDNASAQPKRRGRPPKAAPAETSDSSTQPKRRGRPPKSTSATTSATSSSPRRRGRPPKKGS